MGVDKSCLYGAYFLQHDNADYALTVNIQRGLRPHFVEHGKKLTETLIVRTIFSRVKIKRFRQPTGSAQFMTKSMSIHFERVNAMYLIRRKYIPNRKDAQIHWNLRNLFVVCIEYS